ncbi:MAG: hypothetical protein WDM94_14925 [Bauldia sp.]
MASHDIILPPGTIAGGIGRSKLAAFVPITLAVLGVGAVLFGGVSARHDDNVAGLHQVDPMTTGAIAAPEDQRRALEMLDR